MSKFLSPTRRIQPYPMVADRHAIVVKPRLAFWEWVNDSNMHNLVIRPKGDEGRVYLVPSGRAAAGWINKHWHKVLETELAVWTRDTDLWPDLTRKQFDAWFTVEDHLVTYDTGTKGLRKMHYPPTVVGPNSVEHRKKMPVIDVP